MEKASEDFQRLNEISCADTAQWHLSVRDAIAEKQQKDVERQWQCREWKKLHIIFIESLIQLILFVKSLIYLFMPKIVWKLHFSAV